MQENEWDCQIDKLPKPDFPVALQTFHSGLQHNESTGSTPGSDGPNQGLRRGGLLHWRRMFLNAGGLGGNGNGSGVF